MTSTALLDVRKLEHDCLICYHRTDAELVIPLLQQLGALGISHWIDCEQIIPGDDWRDKIPPALKQSRLVVIFFGPGPPGRWQMEEWRYLSKECLETGKRFIPVVLPGGSLPEDLQLGPRVSVVFDGDPKRDHIAFEQLVDAIDKRKKVAHEFHLVIRTASEGASCCLALPFDADPRLVVALHQAIARTEMKLIQTTDGSQQASYRTDVIAAVRNSSILLADCTLNPATRMPDPNVAIQIGVAKCLNKPILVVTNSPLPVAPLFKIVEQEPVTWPDDPMSDDAFIARVEARLQSLFQHLKHPYLVPGDCGDVGVVRADLWTMHSAFWESFRQLQDTGLKIHHAYRQAVPAVHSLERLTEVLHENLVFVENDVHQQHDFCQVSRTQHDYAAIHENQVVPALLWFEAEHSRNLQALKSLSARAGNSTGRLVERVQRYYQLLRSMIDVYKTASTQLAAADWLPATPTIDQFVHGKVQVTALRMAVDDVERHAFELLTCLLELIGHPPRNGVSANGR